MPGVGSAGRKHRGAVCGEFHKETMKLLARSDTISQRQVKVYGFLNRIGVNHIFWHKFWRDNGVDGHGLDRPFTDTFISSSKGQ